MALTDNLISYYSLNGHTNDLVGTNDGTDSGATSTTGKVGGAYHFDGSNDEVTFSNLGLSGNAVRSASAWIKLGSTSQSSWNNIFGWTGSDSANHFCNISNDSANNVVVHFYATQYTISSNSSLGTSNWHHIVFVYDQSTIKVYLDNVLKVNQNYSSLNTDGNFNLGKRSSSYYNGDIDEVGVWDRALTASEVSELYNSGNGKTYFDGEFIDSPNLREEIISYYKLDETSGTVIDSAGSNNGTNNGATTGVTGKINTAYSFDGSNDYINCGNISLNNKSFSISAWLANTYSGSSNSYSFGQGTNSTDHSLHIGRRGSSGKFTFAFYGDDMDSNTNMGTDGTWEYWTVTYDATTRSRKIYRNGVLDISGTAGANYQGTGDFLIGQALAGSAHFYGKIDEVGIWNRALTASEVSDLYNNGDGFSYPFIDAKIQSLSDSFSTSDSFTYNIVKLVGLNENISSADSINKTFPYVLTENTSLNDTVQLPHFAESSSISFNNGFINTARINVIYTDSEPLMYLSADGGTNWEAVDNNVLHTFANKGTDLRWKLKGAGSTITKITVDKYK